MHENTGHKPPTPNSDERYTPYTSPSSWKSWPNRPPSSGSQSSRLGRVSGRTTLA